MYFENPIGFNGAKKRLPSGCHIEAAKGDAAANRKYCSKEGDFFELGTPPQQGKRKDLDEVRDQVSRRVHIRQIAQTVSSYQALKFAQALIALQPLPPRPSVTVFWFYGPSGSGKTTTAFTHVRESSDGDELCYVKSPNKWWDAYCGEPTVLYDDFRDTACSADELLHVLQPFPFRAEYKGSSVGIAATYFLITSIHAPWSIYPREPAV